MNSDFWDFRIDEVAEYDIPAMLGYILNFTGQEKLQYIGHSMGPALAIIAMGSHPDIADKIKMAHFLAPYAYSGIHVK